MKTKRKILSIFLIFLTILNLNAVNVSAAKRVVASSKYIWVYVEGQRKFIPTKYGYPCFGQGTDNKNVLYVPLRLLTDITGCELSEVEKSTSLTGSTLKCTVSGPFNFDVTLYSDVINDIKIAGNVFLLNGTVATNTNVVMVPLGVAKDIFGLSTEVKRPVGRGIYDYCSLGINFTGDAIVSTDEIIAVPNSSGTASTDVLEDATDTVYVDTDANHYYHSSNCEMLTYGSNIASMTEYEAAKWGFTKCPNCLGD